MPTSITLSDDYAEKLENQAEEEQRSMAGQVRHYIDKKEAED